MVGRFNATGARVSGVGISSGACAASTASGGGGGASVMASGSVAACMSVSTTSGGGVASTTGAAPSCSIPSAMTLPCGSVTTIFICSFWVAKNAFIDRLRFLGGSTKQLRYNSLPFVDAVPKTTFLVSPSCLACRPRTSGLRFRCSENTVPAAFLPRQIAKFRSFVRASEICSFISSSSRALIGIRLVP